MKLSLQEVEHIALLARLGLTDSEKERLREQLSNILDQFETLQQVDTTTVTPTAQATNLQNVTREDQTSPSLTQDQVLTNAPQRETEYFRVRAIME